MTLTDPFIIFTETGNRLLQNLANRERKLLFVKISVVGKYGLMHLHLILKYIPCERTTFTSFYS